MKPLMRGYIPQAAFIMSLCACTILISQSHGVRALSSAIIYSLTLTLLFGVSTLYHRPMWSRRNYLLIKRIDHAAIFALIAGTATPICILGLKDEGGLRLLTLLWSIAMIGMLLSIFWVHAPKWARTLLYVAIGWLALPYLPRMQSALGLTDMRLLLIGGIVYTVGALVYAFKWPNPLPQVFGYHEIFHIFIVIASGFHFKVIYMLAT